MTFALQGEPLTEADLANLKFITPELAEATRLRRVDSSTGATLIELFATHRNNLKSFCGYAKEARKRTSILKTKPGTKFITTPGFLLHRM